MGVFNPGVLKPLFGGPEYGRMSGCNRRGKTIVINNKTDTDIK
jgi:hypothetical protein